MATATTTKARYGRTTGVNFDLGGALQAQRDMGLLADRLPWMQERAIRTLARRLPVEARRDIQAEYNILARRVREHLTARVISGGDSTRLAGVRLVGQWKRGIGLRNFSGRATRKGVTYSVYRGRRSLAEGAFLARLKGGNVQAVERVTSLPKVQRKYTDRRGKGHGPVRQRTRMDHPLQVLYRSTVAQMLAKGRRPERLLDYSRGILQREVERQLQSYLRNPSTP